MKQSKLEKKLQERINRMCDKIETLERERDAIEVKIDRLQDSVMENQAKLEWLENLNR